MFSLCCSVCDYACMEETDMKNHISTGHAGTEPPMVPWSRVTACLTCAHSLSEHHHLYISCRRWLGFSLKLLTVWLVNCLVLFLLVKELNVLGGSRIRDSVPETLFYGVIFKMTFTCYEWVAAYTLWLLFTAQNRNTVQYLDSDTFLLFWLCTPTHGI